MQTKGDYEVICEKVTTLKYLVSDVRTPDEAEQVAEKWAMEGEEGEVLHTEITDCTAERVETD